MLIRIPPRSNRSVFCHAYMERIWLKLHSRRSAFPEQKASWRFVVAANAEYRSQPGLSRASTSTSGSAVASVAMMLETGRVAGDGTAAARRILRSADFCGRTDGICASWTTLSMTMTSQMN